MTTIYLTEKKEYTSVWYLDIEGDLFATKEEAEICGIDQEIIADGFYVGSIEDWKKSILLRINNER